MAKFDVRLAAWRYFLGALVCTAVDGAIGGIYHALTAGTWDRSSLAKAAVIGAVGAATADFHAWRTWNRLTFARK